MKSRKYYYALWLFASVWLTIIASMWVGKDLSYQVSLKDQEVVKEHFQKAIDKPEEFLSDYFELLSNKRYSKYAYANVMGLLLADAHSQERSGLMYVRAMHVLNERNIKLFLLHTYSRLMEKDRKEYEDLEAKFPDTIQNNIENMFSNRPVFSFSQKENIAIIKCVEDAKNGVVEENTLLSKVFGSERSEGCHSLMKIHNNIHL